MASIRNKMRVKELADKKLEQDLKRFGEDYVCEGLDEEELDIYMRVLNILPDEDKEYWKFFLYDDVFNKIIDDGGLMEYYLYPEYDMEMCLEEAKDLGVIKGFVRLSTDLWLIRE